MQKAGTVILKKDLKRSDSKERFEEESKRIVDAEFDVGEDCDD